MAAALLWSSAPGAAEATRSIAIVAAENFYGDVASQIGGAEVTIISIISTPRRDPHQFEASPATARAIADADIVIANGAGYDLWIDRLLAAMPSARRATIVVADLVTARAGDNPHLWYAPNTMPALATRIAEELAARDPAHADLFRRRLAAFRGSLALLDAQIGAIKDKHRGAPVAATEPVFGPMAQALGLAMRDERFQLAVMHGTEPSARDLAALEDDLANRRVRLLFRNSQVSGALTERLVAMALAAKVPVVAISETEPAGTTYQKWVADELGAVEQALAGGAP